MKYLFFDIECANCNDRRGKSYSYERHNIVITSQNTYFYEEFGLNIFEPIKIEKIPYFLKSLALSEDI